MQINQVSNINFESTGKKFVSQKTQANAQKLLKMMNSETKYTENSQGTTYTSDIMASISLGDNVRFVDNRFLVAPTNKIPNGPDTSLYIGKKFITFNSISGEILRYKKGFFSTYRGFLSDVDKTISALAEYFNNSDVVRKNSYKIKGFTQKGMDILNSYTK